MHVFQWVLGFVRLTWQGMSLPHKPRIWIYGNDHNCSHPGWFSSSHKDGINKTIDGNRARVLRWLDRLVSTSARDDWSKIRCQITASEWKGFTASGLWSLPVRLLFIRGLLLFGIAHFLVTWLLSSWSRWRCSLISFMFSAFPQYLKSIYLFHPMSLNRKGPRHVWINMSSSAAGPALGFIPSWGPPNYCHQLLWNRISIASTFCGSYDRLALAQNVQISLCDSCDLFQVKFLARGWCFHKLRFTPSVCGWCLPEHVEVPQGGWQKH